MRGIGLVVIALAGCNQDQQDRAYGDIFLDHKSHIVLEKLYVYQRAVGYVVDDCPAGAEPGCGTQNWRATSVDTRFPVGNGVVLPDGSFEIEGLYAGGGSVTVHVSDGDESTIVSASVTVHDYDDPVDAPIMTNPDKCTTAPIVISGMYQGDSTAYMDDATPPGSCTNGFSAFGPDAFYRVDLVAGQVLNATVMPSGWDAMLYVLHDCIANACTAGVDAGGPGVAETTSFTATTDGTYHVVVDSPDQTAKGPFTLDVTVQ